MRAAALILVLAAAPAFAQTGDAWSQRKCALYSDAWTRALESLGPEGIGADFIAAHEAFIAEGCVLRGAVCPETAQEYRLADILTIAAMNEGMASTFLPFACPG